MRYTVGLVWLLGACAGATGGKPNAAEVPPARLDARPALVLLQQSRFAEAEAKASEIVAQEAHNPLANAVAAITLYERTMHDLIMDGVAIVAGAAAMGTINHSYLTFAIDKAAGNLAQVTQHLDAARGDPELRFDLCLACWQKDWNRDGAIDDRDARLFEVEYDADGELLAEGDPGRRPTFWLDTGDVSWAAAMVRFQRAALSVLRAFDYGEVEPALQRLRTGSGFDVVRFRLADPARVAQAKDLIAAALEDAARARTAYLAETDDEGEWLPSPRQRSHPLPMPVTDELYATWGAALEDLQRLLRGEEGLDVAAIAQLGDHTWEKPPRGYINVGRLLESPGDLVLDRRHLEGVVDREDPQAAQQVLRDLFGDKYVDQMKPSRLTQTLARIKGEVDRGEETLDRKLRYLFWLN